ncbi:hypothetical protein UlMin_032416 [Ulmus minor]
MTRPTHSDTSRNKFQVFDFDDDESIGHTFRNRFAGKLRNRRPTKKTKLEESPITKYHFLQSFAHGAKITNQDVSNEPIDVDDGDEEDCNALLDVDASGVGFRSTYSINCSKSEGIGDGAVKEESNGFDAFSISSSSNYKNEPLAMISDGNISTGVSSSSISTCCFAENQVPLEGQSEESDSSGFEIDDKKMTVTVSPDYIMYGEINWRESCLTFSRSCVRLEGSTLNGPEIFFFEWAIGDIINIKSEWYARMRTAAVNIHLKSKNSEGAGNANSTSGAELLFFIVYDPCWAKHQEAVIKLDGKYKDKWNNDFGSDLISDGKDLLGQSSMFSPKRYFPSSDEPFEDVVYPKGEPDAVIISKRDIRLLQPETFINDTIIDFYIKYLANNIQHEEKHRFHFFNSFFFRKLADLDKDPSNAYDCEAAFERVRKWTRKVDLFEKDYIFIPVNYSLHWSLLVICHPGEVPSFKDDETQNAQKVPCILHMDSIEGSHRGLKNLIQSYICEEWKARHPETEEDVLSKFLHLRFVSLELPQQENSFDCGIFLLYYVELFLKEAPSSFNPFNISKYSGFLTRNWFPPKEASRKRSSIENLMYEILKDNSQEAPADSIDKYPSSTVPNKIENQGNEVIILEKAGSPKTCHGISSSSNHQQIGISMSDATTSRCDQSFEYHSQKDPPAPERNKLDNQESGVIFLEKMDSSTKTCYDISSSSSHEQIGISSAVATTSRAEVNDPHLGAPCHRSILPPVEEVEESGEQVAESPFDEQLCQLKTGLVSDSSSMSSIRVSFRAETSGTYKTSLSIEELVETNSVSETPFESRTLPKVGRHGDYPLQENKEFDLPVKQGQQELSPTLSEELAACIVPDSQEADNENNSNKIMHIPSTYPKHNLFRTPKKALSTEIIIVEGNTPRSNENAVSKSDEPQLKKRRRRQHPEGERRFTRSLARALQL